MLSNLYKLVIAGKQKAIVAFVVTTITAFVAKHGVTLDANTQAFIQAVLFGLVAHIAVYLKANK